MVVAIGSTEYVVQAFRGSLIDKQFEGKQALIGSKYMYFVITDALLTLFFYIEGNETCGSFHFMRKFFVYLQVYSLPAATRGTRRPFLCGHRQC